MFKKICLETARFVDPLMGSQMGGRCSDQTTTTPLDFKNRKLTTYISIRTQPIETKRPQP